MDSQRIFDHRINSIVTESFHDFKRIPLFKESISQKCFVGIVLTSLPSTGTLLSVSALLPSEPFTIALSPSCFRPDF